MSLSYNFTKIKSKQKLTYKGKQDTCQTKTMKSWKLKYVTSGNRACLHLSIQISNFNFQNAQIQNACLYLCL